MSRIRAKNTKPEKIVRSTIHRMGYRFSLHNKGLPGKPDITLPKYKTVIFVHGCFWHRHENCKYSTTPKSNVDFWTNKFEDNIKRDQSNYEALRKIGWKVVVIWECEVKDSEKLPIILKEKLPHRDLSS